MEQYGTFFGRPVIRANRLQLFTDASATLGYGSYFQDAWFRGSWPLWLAKINPSIEYLELGPILIALATWAKYFQRKKIISICDNLGAVNAWAALKSTLSVVLNNMRRMVFIAAENYFTLTLKHINRVDYSLADALSRSWMARFRHMARLADPYPAAQPEIFPSLRLHFPPQQTT